MILISRKRPYQGEWRSSQRGCPHPSSQTVRAVCSSAFLGRVENFRCEGEVLLCLSVSDEHRARYLWLAATVSHMVRYSRPLGLFITALPLAQSLACAFCISAGYFIRTRCSGRALSNGKRKSLCAQVCLRCINDLVRVEVVLNVCCLRVMHDAHPLLCVGTSF